MRGSLLSSDPKNTLTGLYNALRLYGILETRALWFMLVAHEKLDAAVAAAYGWTWPLTQEEVLGRLLALNLERTG